MSIIVPRTCTEILPESPDLPRESVCGPLDTFRAAPAYVLLGDPGSGKSTAFGVEAKTLGEDAVLVSARDFLTFGVDNHPEWQGKILFIDGLDEIRVGSDDRRKALDEIRHHLYALGRPRFRISCREADWLGNNDRTALTSVSADQKVNTLRLNPLTDDDVAQILDGHPSVNDARGFMAEARARGVDGLLSNPLTLDMLARAVGADGAWPQSKLETFEMACLQLAVEKNEEHVLGNRPPPRDKLLDSAGQLCVYQLISDSVGFSLRYEDGDADYIAPETQIGLTFELVRHVLETRLFASAGDGRFTPVHRHIAEFLGARYLAKIISEGLPVARVLSLITGGDGTVVTALRGLFAWLVAHCPSGRDRLIDRDPVGVGLYGDLQGFKTGEKRNLLVSLNHEVGYQRNVSAFVPLATPDMQGAIRDFLVDQRRDMDHQRVTGFILRVLYQAEPLAGLCQTLLDVLYDDSWLPWVAHAALAAFIHASADNEDGIGKLKQTMADIRDERLHDPDHEMLGLLLTSLYPQEIPPSDIWEYLSPGGNPSLIGAYHLFWARRMFQRSSDEDVAELLDQLHKRMPTLRRAFDVHNLDPLPERLLARALRTVGHQQDLARLCNWLEVGVSSNPGRFLWSDDPSSQTCAWLEQRPETQKAVCLEALLRCPDDDRFELCAVEAWDLLHGSAPPPDFGLWCLDNAVAYSDTHTRVSHHLLRYAVHFCDREDGGQGLTKEVLRERTQGHPALELRLAELLEPPPLAVAGGRRDKVDATNSETDHRLNRWRALVRSNAAALHDNQADPQLLFEIGMAYFYGFPPAVPHVASESGLADVLGDDDLVEAATAGLCGTVWHDALPEIAEISRLHVESKMHPLGPPFLAGLAEMYRANPDEIETLICAQMQRAVAFYYCTPTGLNTEPLWYLRWVVSRPELVADVLAQCAGAAIRGEREYVPGLEQLIHQEDHGRVAAFASLSLLSAFPVRCKPRQLETLDLLLWAALQHAEPSALRALIREKLSRVSMRVAQRIHWLAAGVIVEPNTYLQPLKTLVSASDDRVRKIAMFFTADSRLPYLVEKLDVSTLQTLIKFMGNTFAPRGMDGGLVMPEMRASEEVEVLIQQLSSLPSDDASRALDELAFDDRLSEWRLFLERARDRQRAIHRDAHYRHPNIEEIRRTLSNEAPANAADLAALLVDRLEELAENIRNDNTDDWRQYWNERARGHPESPKIEEHCRDALLSDLRKLLPAGVDAQPEGQYANDKRSDIRVSHGPYNVPVEIKRDIHPDLWSALHSQLIAQYTSDPATGGHGTYLVFWFDHRNIPLPPQGHRPTSPMELRERLEEQLTSEEGRRISVCVVDVSRGGEQHSPSGNFT